MAHAGTLKHTDSVTNTAMSNDANTFGLSLRDDEHQDGEIIVDVHVWYEEPCAANRFEGMADIESVYNAETGEEIKCTKEQLDALWEQVEAQKV